jgi:predicted RNase H-like HicB family nuclease
MQENIMEVNEYLKLPYNIIIRHIVDESGSYYLATIFEFDGCMSDGATYQEAFENIQEAMAGWIETKLANDFPVPPPVDAEICAYKSTTGYREVEKERRKEK